MKFIKLLWKQRAVVPNMHRFMTFSDVSLDVLWEMVGDDEKLRHSLGFAKKILKGGIKLAGGQYHPDNTSMGRPFTIAGALNALESVRGFYGDLTIRPGTLIEFVNYIASGGQVTQNCIIVGDSECPTYFQFTTRDSCFMLTAPSKTEHPVDKFLLEGCHGIFVVAEPHS